MEKLENGARRDAGSPREGSGATPRGRVTATTGKSDRPLPWVTPPDS